MVGLVVATHGQLAEELLRTASGHRRAPGAVRGL